jgi:acyl-CoA synthetase (AMP-forming)/AMP-acid ligase II
VTATKIDAGDGLPLTLPALLQARVADRGASVLLVCDDDVLTYEAAERRSAGLARGLLAAGAGKGTHIGILHPNGSEFVVAWLAAARIGAVAVPLSTFSRSAELHALLRTADVRVLLSARSYRSHDYVVTLRQAVPGLDSSLPPPPLFESLPVLRRIAFAEPCADVHREWSVRGLEEGGPSSPRFSRRWRLRSFPETGS